MLVQSDKRKRAGNIRALMDRSERAERKGFPFDHCHYLVREGLKRHRAETGERRSARGFGPGGRLGPGRWQYRDGQWHPVDAPAKASELQGEGHA
jgi:hypothetical protein